MMKTRTPLHVAVVLVALGVWSAAPAAQAPPPDCDSPCIDRLKAKLDLLRKVRQTNESGAFIKRSLESAQEIDAAGFTQLPSTRDMLDATKVIWDRWMEKVAEQTTLPKPGQARASATFMARVHDNETMLKYPGDLAFKGYDAGVALEEMQKKRAPPSSTRELDEEIADYEHWRKITGAAVLVVDPLGRFSSTTKVADAVISPLLVRDYLQRAHLATSSDERQKNLEKAGKESVKFIKTFLEINKDSLVGAEVIGKDFLVEAKLIEANWNIWSKLVYWGGAHYVAEGERAKAEAVRNDAVGGLTYNIMVTQYQIDEAERRLRIQNHKAALLPTREPGGIKLGGVTADVIASRIDVTGIAFDPAGGRLILSGRDSTHPIDLAILSDVMRLALERADPFFSLNPVTSKDWDETAVFVGQRLYDEYFKTPDGPAAFTARLERSGQRVPMAGRDCYYAFVRDFDRDLHRQVEEKFDIREERVYSPEWLAYSPVGRILFEADLAIKAVAAGVLETGDQQATSLAPVWSIPGFTPRWMLPPDGNAGRANFELDDSNVPADGGFLDLSNIKPKLVMVRREAGTETDLEPGKTDELVTRHFDNHWKEYVARVPVLQELMTVFRAYVAARYLARYHPSLAQRVLSWSKLTDGTGVPLYNVRSDTIFACLSGGRLAPLYPGTTKVFTVGGGFGGGISMSLKKSTGEDVVHIVNDGRPNEEAAFLRRAMNAGGDVVVEQGRRALILDLGSPDTVPSGSQFAWWAICVGGACGCLGVAALVGRRRFTLGTACPHCVRVHRLTEALGGLGDVAALSTLTFLATLPVLAAVQESGQVDARLAVVVLAVVSLLVVGMVLSRGLQTLVAARLGWSGPWGGSIRRVGAGARWFGLALAVVVLGGGLSEPAVREHLISLMGAPTGEQLLTLLESAETIRAAAFVLAGAAVLAVLARWLLPRLLHSRPLPFGLTTEDHEDHP
jgi:hypothetical protein